MALKELLEQLAQRISLDHGLQDETRDPVMKQIIDGLVIDRRWNLVNVIEEMEFLLIHPDPPQRSKGVKILGLLLKLLPPSHLAAPEVDHLCLFLCDRLKDHPDVVPQAIRALVFLTAHQNLPEDFAIRVFNNLVKELLVPQMKVSDRLACYQLVKFLIIDRYQELKTIGANVVQGWIQIMEGEADPRCLVLVLHISEFVARNYNLEPLTEDLFEVISVYFPVTFKPSEDDDYGITREDLANGINNVLRANSKFAEYCLPFMLEKLESSILDTKIDAYEALIECLSSYTPFSVKPFAEPLWTCIRIDSLRPDSSCESLLSHKALETLFVLCTLLSSESQAIENLAEQIWHDIIPAFKKPELGLLLSATKISSNLAKCHSPSLHRIRTEILPSIVQRISFIDSPSQRVSCFNSITILCPLDTQVDQELLDSFITTSLSIVANEYENEDLRLAALQTIDCLIKSIPKLSSSLILMTLIAENLLSLCLKPHESPSITGKAQASLESIHCSEEIFTKVVIKKLRETVVHGIEDGEEPMRASFLALESINQLAKQPMVREQMHESLINLLNSLSISADEGSSKEAFALAVASCLKNFLAFASVENSSANLKHKYFEPLSHHVIHCTLCTDRVTKSGQPSIPNLNILRFICLELLCLSIQKLPRHEIVDILEDELNYFLNGAVERVLKVVPPSCYCKFTPGPSLISSLNQQAVTVTLLHFQAVIMGSFDVIEAKNLASPNYLNVLGKLKSFALEMPMDEAEQEIVSQVMALFILKAARTSRECESNPLIKEAHVLYDNVNNPRQYRLFKWIFKALVLAGASYNELLDSAIERLKGPDDENSENIVGLFPFVLCADNVIEKHLHRQNFNPLYRQKFYALSFGKLWTIFNSYNPENASKDEQQQNQIAGKVRNRAAAAILGQLKLLPESIYRDDLEKLLPILLYSLKNSTDPTIQNVTLQSLCHLLSRDPDRMQSHIDSLVQDCVTLATKSPSLIVRRSACENLALISQKFDPFILLPHRMRVVKALKDTLDDKKRLVRRKAAEARCRWISLGQPGAA